MVAPVESKHLSSPPHKKRGWKDDGCWHNIYRRRERWELAHGRKLLRTEYLHTTCGTPNCCNPKHTAPGTFQECHQNHPPRPEKRKLRPKQVQEIRDLWWSGCRSQNELAAEYKVSQPSISAIVRRTCWKAQQPGVVEEIAKPQYRGFKNGRRPLPLADLQHPESDQPLNTGTGRIIGPDGMIYSGVRAVEVHTGMDRLDLARALLVGQTWRYEPGEPPLYSHGW